MGGIYRVERTFIATLQHILKDNLPDRIYVIVGAEYGY
jgi:hypothetical protein